MLSAVRTAIAPTARAALRQGQVRYAGGIKILEEGHKAQENLYMHQEDERLLKKMVANHPELSPEYQGVAAILNDDAHKLEDKIKLVFMKHGIPPINKALIKDIAALAEK
eukprot:TRINITY_DN776_c0_g1_i2.p1 TRINITY_DN776_c0_g1~~TRINITY_DN776_c0_g1_i2.p1  ORF type:complete len:110 (+),score=31.64 TRINITY_DN776_c0_g1_i2:90-419(+)